METTRQHAQDVQIPGEIARTHASASPSHQAKQSGTATIADSGAVQLEDKHVALLENRGLDTELLVRLGWKSISNQGAGDWIEIPYFLNGQKVNAKYRTISGEKKFRQIEGGKKCFYNADVIQDLGNKPLVITEGEMDCIIALQCGFMAVSVPDGAPKEAIGDRDTVKYDYLEAFPPKIPVILATDGDGPGASLLHDLSMRIGKHRSKWVKYPKGCKDLNDVYIQHGPQKVIEIIEGADYVKVGGLYRMDELPPLPQHPALDIRIEGMSDHLKIRRGDLSVCTGIPSHGKSTFVNNLAFNMAKHHSWNICFASFEQPPQTEHRKNLQTLFLQRPAHLANREERNNADIFIQKHFSFIVPDDESHEECGLAWLLERAAAAVMRYGADMLVVDPWNEMDHMFDQRAMSITQYVGFAIKELKRFARRYQVHVMVVAHPAKMRKDKDGDYPIPTPYDISDSAHWYNKPEQAFVVHRVDDVTRIRVSKSRYHSILGKPGDVDLKFNDYDNNFYGI